MLKYFQNLYYEIIHKQALLYVDYKYDLFKIIIEVPKIKEKTLLKFYKKLYKKKYSLINKELLQSKKKTISTISKSNFNKSEDIKSFSNLNYNLIKKRFYVLHDLNNKDFYSHYLNEDSFSYKLNLVKVKGYSVRKDKIYAHSKNVKNNKILHIILNSYVKTRNLSW